ncbi:hypothetical protein QJS04_geneDACA007939 [Acorus gramineus]|uniref:Uncharacterized protein n=1 Tax=Acorus gramineus TaxID=55184 RepID=A0AAV9B9I0_ACOGR|nr:hypothetical protein QJS04_geneDACA007939 [Acorus gramineus]
MFSTSSLMFSNTLAPNSPMIVSSHKFISSQNSDKSELHKEPIWSSISRKLSHSSCGVLQKSVPLAASAAILLWSSPVDAGILSGFSGLESLPGPELPRIDFLNKFNEDNQKKYAEFDSRFKSSTVLKELLEKSKVNQEKNKKEIQDKYCMRGAEWGVGDCSTQGMTDEEKENFIAMLKKNSATE